MDETLHRREILRLAGGFALLAGGNAASGLLDSYGNRASAQTIDMSRPSAVSASSPPMFASTRLHAPVVVHTADTSARTHRLSEIAFATPPYAVRMPRFAFVNWYSLPNERRPAERDTGNDLAIRGAAIRVAGVHHRLAFSGRPAFAIPSGGFVISDPLDLAIPPGAQVSIRTADEVPVGGKRPSGLFRQAFRGEACRVGDAFDEALLTDGPVAHNYSSGGLYGPCFMLAEGWPGDPVALSLGDSIGFGQEDSGEHADARGNFGYVARGLDAAEGGRIPYAQMAVPGSAPSEMSSLQGGQFRRRHELLSAARQIGGRWPFTHIVSEHGVNDSYASGDWTVLRDKMRAWWDFLDTAFEGTPIVQTTYTPRALAAAPDFFTTLDSQSEAQNNRHPGGVRWKTADFIRTVPRPLRGVIDVQPWFSDPSEPGKWTPRAFVSRLTADAAPRASKIALREAPAVGELLVIAPGDRDAADAGAAALTVDAVAGTGPFTVSLSGRTTKFHAAGTVVKAMPTRDGSHPSALLHVRAAQAVVDAKLAGLFRGPA